MSGVSIQTKGYFPDKFFNKEVNEPFIKWALSKSFLFENKWRSGNAEKKEPDYFYDNMPFEFTLACDEKSYDTFIFRLKTGKYTSEDVEKDILSYINTSIKKKAEKEYSVEGVHVVVLVPIDMFYWVSDIYGSVTHCLGDYRRKQAFNKLKKIYIESGVFNNIFIMFPDISAKWWIYDVKTDNRACAFLSDEDIKNKKYPYIVINDDSLNDLI